MIDNEVPEYIISITDFTGAQIMECWVPGVSSVSERDRLVALAHTLRDLSNEYGRQARNVL